MLTAALLNKTFIKNIKGDAPRLLRKVFRLVSKKLQGF